MANVQLFVETYGWQLLAVVVVVGLGTGLRWYGKILERQTRERSKRP